MGRLRRRYRRYGRASGRGAKWDIHIHNPRTGVTTTKRAVVFEGTEPSMSWARYVIVEASKRFRVKQDHILAIPTPGQLPWVITDKDPKDYE